MSNNVKTLPPRQDAGEVRNMAPPTVEEQPHVPESVASVLEDSEVLHASLKAGSIAQIVIALVAIVGLLYFLKIVMITSLVALLLAFVLEPLVDQFARIAIPRATGALVAVVVAAVFAGGLGYFLYNQVDSFASQLPQYSERIRQGLARIERPISRLESSTRQMANPSKDGRLPVPVQVQEAPAVSRIVVSNFGTIGEFLLAMSFIPFMTYFMLTCKQHAHAATVQLFPEEHRLVAFRTVTRISRMIRSFLVGNLIAGLIGAVCCTVLFGLLGIPFFYFIGIICGFLNLIPSIGALLALLPPLVGGAGILHRSGYLFVVLGVISIHAMTMNVLYPKLVGKRVRLNPLAVILSLLFWAWIWGAIGLVLAIPIAAAVKIVCDHTDSLSGFGAWLGT
jgi:predicted PurR-regulated permease PerM